MKKGWIITALVLFSCKKSPEKVSPTIRSISESVYASGLIKSRNQYQCYPKVNGIIEKIYVQEGDYVKKAQVLFSIANQTQKLNQENALLNLNFMDIQANQGKLQEAKTMVDLAYSKMQNDSLLYERQKSLWQENIGTQLELEQRQLQYDNAKAAYLSAIVKYQDLKRQLEFNYEQSKKNYQISRTLTGDFEVRSEVEGIVYQINYKVGEFVSVQTPVAVIGSGKDFVLELQVDEYDIMKIKKGQKVFVSMDSYKGKVFEAKITKINPIMNQRNKTFTVEAEFLHAPDNLFPNLTFEANILLQHKEKALLIPRDFVEGDSIVFLADGQKVKIQTGLKDYSFIEVLSGLKPEDIIIKPTK